MKIFNYVEASEFSKWVDMTFGIKDSYDKLLENDYVEGRLGSRWPLGYVDENKLEISQWYNDFLIEFDLNEIQLKY